MTTYQTYPNRPKDFIVKDTHRVLWYSDGVLTKVLEAGHHEYPKQRLVDRILRRRLPEIAITMVDVRERDMTIKGQEILTSDKVAIRVSIIVRYRVIDPTAAVHAVEDYEARIYTDVQLAARRSLASTSLEEILTNRNRLSEDILAEVKDSAAGYGVEIGRADVKDLVFPGNLEEVMNRVLTAERTAEAQLIEARAKAEVDRIDAQTRADVQRIRVEAQAVETRLQAEADAAAEEIKTQAEVRNLRERSEAAGVYTEHPSLLRQLELETLRDLSRTATARLYIGFGADVKGEIGE